MGAPNKRAKKVRSAAEFDTGRLNSAIRPPRGSGVSLTSWTLAEIFNARDQQMLGNFALPARMADSMRTDDALAVAKENRLAPQRCIRVELVPAKSARGAGVAAEAEALFGQAGVGISPDAIASIHSCLVDHDVAFAYCVATPRPDGSRVDFELHAWPIEHVRWDSFSRCYMTRVDPESIAPGDLSAGGPDVRASSAEVPIVHGDGRWVIFQRYEITPFKHAAILSAAVVWARHAYAIRDWAKGSVAHGSAKVIGAMPEGVALQDAGGMTPEATAFADLLRSVASSDSPVGIKPFGASLDFLTNTSTAWQIWKELVENAERAAARVYLGTDGTLGTNGGAPGIDIASLFGVATTKVQGDLACLERGILTGVIEPWTAVNFGDSSLAPRRRYMLPDDDERALKESLAARSAAFYSDVKGLTEARIPLTQEMLDGLASDYGVRAPKLPVAPVVTPAESTAAPAVAAPPALRRV